MVHEINILWRAYSLLPVGLSIDDIRPYGWAYIIYGLSELLNLKQLWVTANHHIILFLFCCIGWGAYSEGSRGLVLKEGLKRRNWELLNRASS